MKSPFVLRAKYERALNEVDAAHRSYDSANEFHIELRRKLFHFTRDLTYNLFSADDHRVRGLTYAAMQDLGRIVGTHT